MKQLTRLCALLCLLVMLPVLGLCQYGTQHTAEDQQTLSAAQSAYQSYYADLAKTHVSEVRTLANGVQVKRTPDACDTYVAGYYHLTDYFTYNHRYLKADKRGCTACHADLAALVENMKGYPHVSMGNKNFYVQTTTQTCLECHNYAGEAFDEYFGGFGSLMHTIHSGKTFDALEGNCWSCHYATGDGAELQLWDDVKHDVLRGITDLDASSVAYTFDWTQDKVLEANQMFDINWHYLEGFLHRQLSAETGLVPDPATDGVYDQWTITVNGEVSKPVTMSITEMLAALPTETDVMTIDCGVNKSGGYIGNFEITGIPLLALKDYVGAADTVTHVEVYSMDGSMFASRIDDIEKFGGYLTLQIGGQPIGYQHGYPVTFWVGADAAWKNTKEVTQISFVTVENEEEYYPIYQWATGYQYDLEGNVVFKPSCGIVGLTEGQIIPADQPLTIEGYSFAFDNQTVAVEFSFDRGQTWITIDLPDVDASRWAYWYFTWTPPAPGAYTVSARTVAADGSRTYNPAEILLNAE